VSQTRNPVSSLSGSDAKMTLSLEDHFGYQPHRWASCSDWIQTMIHKNISETLKAKMQQEHTVREDRC